MAKSYKITFPDILLIIYLALGPVSWFGTSTIGFVKRIILFLLILTLIPSLKKKRSHDLSIILIAYLFLSISLWVNQTETFPLLLVCGLLENIFFFLIGYNYLKNHKDLKNIAPYINGILGFFCLLTVTNFFIGIPAWTSPAMQMIEEEKNMVILEYDKLWQTGFSWSRSGWGISLSLYLPLLLLVQSGKGKKYKFFVLSFFLILLSLILCGNRSGLLGFLLTNIIILRNKNIAAQFKRTIRFLKLLTPVLILVFSSFLLEHFRLNSNNFTANRLDMYAYIPNMISNMKFWGMGDGSTSLLLNKLAGLNFQLHNTAVKSIIEYGWLYGLTIIYIMIMLVVRFFKSYKKDVELAIYGSILVSGIITSMFEPAAIFGYLGGYSLWWLVFGLFSYRYKIVNP